MKVPTLQELRKVDISLRAREFCTFARYIGASRGAMQDAAVLAERQGASKRVQAIIKAAVSAGLPSGDTWGGPLADFSNLVGAFVGSLANVGIFDRVLADAQPMPLKTRAAVVTSALSGSTASPGGAKPITKFALTGSVLEERKALALIVTTMELLRDTSDAGLDLLTGELRKGVAAAADRTFLDALVAGVTPISSVGSTAAAAYEDISKLTEAISTGSASSIYIVMSDTNAKRLALKPTTTGAMAFPDMTPSGGTIANIPALVSDHIANDDVLAVDAAQIAANGGSVILNLATEGSIEMDDSPAHGSGGIGSPPGPAGSTLVSLWQSDSAALLAERVFGFEVLRPNAVAALQNVDWTNSTTSP